jgi:RNA polymerase sigma-70 factor (ECF subfamily)
VAASTAFLSAGATLDRVDATTHQSNERALVERALSDPDAFGELYRRYLSRIHDFAYRRTGSVEAAEDICAATFESALRSLGSFRWRSGERGGFAPWLFRIASRQTITYYRKEGRVHSERGQQAVAALISGEALGADEFANLGDDMDDLRSALDSLNERYQRAIALRYLADLDVAAAAAAMGLARPAFSVVLTRATAALRRELERSNGASNDR